MIHHQLEWEPLHEAAEHRQLGEVGGVNHDGGAVVAARGGLQVAHVEVQAR